MIEITFQKPEDAGGFYRYLQLYLASASLMNQQFLQIEDQHIVKINIGSNRQTHLDMIKEAFLKFILINKQDDWFRRILADHYCYKDEGEQQQILEIIHSIIEGSRKDLAAFLTEIDIEKPLKTAIHELFNGHISFSFDSFVKFRMRPILELMEKYVDISIDEYKMEQEYQMFIQTLREFLRGRQAKYDHIHLLMDETTSFFNESFFEIKRSDLTRMIDRKLLINHPVYVDSVTIAPLLSLAPNAIYLYTNDRELPLVRTIQNIFEERLHFCSLNEFYKNKLILSYMADEKI